MFSRIKDWILLIAVLCVAGIASAEDRSVGPAEVYFGISPTTSIDELPVEVVGGKNSVILVVIDALNASHLGAYGAGAGMSPNIDAIARNGTMFTNWVSSAPWTRPAFTTIVTGLPRSVHKMEMEGNRLSSDITTLAELFRRNGYATGAFIGNPVIQKRWGYAQGFDVFEDASVHGSFPRAEVLINSAISWIEKKKKSPRPFFAMLFLTDPHAPYDPPEAYRTTPSALDASQRMIDPPKEVWVPFSKPVQEDLLAAYNGEVSYVDAQVGKLIAALSVSNLLETITLALTADHGEIFGGHNCYSHAWHMWDEVLRVPFIIRSPSLPKTGVITDTPATHLDVMPTLAHLSGFASPAGRLGHSVFSTRSDSEPILFSQYDAKGVLRQSARQGRWKLVYYAPVDLKKLARLDGGSTGEGGQIAPSIEKPSPRYELYDLVADPLEQTNVLDEHETDATIIALIQYLRKLSEHTPHTPKRPSPPRAIPLDPELEEALKAGGYLQ